MRLIYITNVVEHAKIVDAAGVDFVMVDLEIMGKHDRQGHLNTLISSHQPSDISGLKVQLKQAKILVRVNPIGPHTPKEIEDSLARGADALMLPMFEHPFEIKRFIDLINGRAEVIPLLETPAAFARLPEILTISGIDTIHFGLNDLHLGMGLNFMFELVAYGLMDFAANHCRLASQAFGIGGMARLGMGSIPSELVLNEYKRMGASQVILSRDFASLYKTLEPQNSWNSEIYKIKQYIRSFKPPKDTNKPANQFRKQCLLVAETMKLTS